MRGRVALPAPRRDVPGCRLSGALRLGAAWRPRALGAARGVRGRPVSLRCRVCPCAAGRPVGTPLSRARSRCGPLRSGSVRGGPPLHALACGRPGGASFGLGQGLCWTPWPTVSTRLCADTTWLGEFRLSIPKACLTDDRPRNRWRRTQEGDAAVPVCVAGVRQVGRARMLVALVGHDGSDGCAAPGPARLCLRVGGCVMPGAQGPGREAMGA